MVLKLRLENETSLPDGGPLSVSIEGKRGIDIGRDAHLDWTLPDPTRYISSKHCEIRYKDGGYWLHDVSTNGTFLNGADHRMHAPHRLRNGDRFSVGHYIVAVALDGAEEASQEGPRSVPRSFVNVSNNQAPWNDEQLWASEGAVPPPINPKELRPARQDAPVHPDFLDWSADVSDPFDQPAPDRPAQPSTRPVSVPHNFDWAEGPPAHRPAPPPSLPASPNPRRPGRQTKEVNASWEAAQPVASEPRPIPPAVRATDTDETVPNSAVESEFLCHIHKSACRISRSSRGPIGTEGARGIGAANRHGTRVARRKPHAAFESSATGQAVGTQLEPYHHSADRQ